MKHVFCLTVILISLTIAGCKQEGSYKTINEKEFKTLIQEDNTVILDVRTPGEYKEGHLENSVLLNYKNESFLSDIDTLDNTKTYLVYCKAGGRSEKASEEMSKKGLKTYNLDGGISQWTGKVVQ